MPRTLVLCFALLSPSVDEADETPLADKIARTDKEFAALEKHFHDEFVAAGRDDQEVRDANKVYQDKWHKAAEELKVLLRGHPDDPATLNGILSLTGARRTFLEDDLAEIALKRRDDPRMSEICFNIRYRGGEPWAQRIFTEVAEHNPSSAVRTQATFCRGEQFRDQAFPWGRVLPAEQKDPLLSDARKYYSQALHGGKDVKTPDGKATIDEKAKHELARLDNLPSLKVGGTAPEIAAGAVDGTQLKLYDYRGKVVALVFWGSWCGPSMAMVPHERELVKKFQGKPFALIGVNCGDTREDAK